MDPHVIMKLAFLQLTLTKYLSGENKGADYQTLVVSVAKELRGKEEYLSLLSLMNKFVRLLDEEYLRSISVCGGGTTPRKHRELQRKLKKTCNEMQAILDCILGA